jgi:hypothetical protein
VSGKAPPTAPDPVAAGAKQVPVACRKGCRRRACWRRAGQPGSATEVEFAVALGHRHPPQREHPREQAVPEAKGGHRLFGVLPARHVPDGRVCGASWIAASVCGLSAFTGSRWLGLGGGGCQLVVSEGFLDALGAGGADALVDRQGLP